jgi:IgA peptidase M64/type IX secretion system substrate protein
MSMKQLILIPFFILTALAVSAQIFDIDTIQYTGDTDARINLVVLSDGYISNELDQFIIDVNDFASEFFSQTPYAEYQDYFNVFAIKVPSNESGATHPGTATDVSEPVHPIMFVDNYFGATFDVGNIHRLLVPTNSFAVSNVLANNFPSYDQVLILVNSPYYGGSGGQYATASLHSSSIEVAIHELGHSFAGLKDEYYAGDNYASEGINMTQETDPTLVKWKNWINDNGIGIYQHCCSGNSSMWYRPHQNCKMRALNNPFCSVCIEGTIERIHFLVSPLDNYTPENNNPINSSSFPVEFALDLIKPQPNTLKINWLLNESGFQNNIDTILISENDLDPGDNNLTVFIQDSTQFLRIDGHESIHINSITWTIEYAMTGITQLSSSSDKMRIEIFPNPSANQLTVKWDSEIKQSFSIDLCNLNGKKLKTFEQINNDMILINLEAFPSGTYMINFSTGNTVITSRKVIKN